MRRAWLLVAALACARAHAAAAEPTEAEMRAAHEARLNGVNQHMKGTLEQCRRREYRQGGGDPALAMQCLVFGSMQAGNGGGAPSMQTSQFRKIACEKAQGEPGYWCDFSAGIDARMPVPPSMAGMLRNGSVSQARFVKTENGWLMMPRRDR